VTPDDFEISVARDASSTARQFFVLSARGPLRPETHVCEHLLRHGATCCYWTQNDCWDVLAGRIARASARRPGRLMQTVTLGDGYRNLHRALGDDDYAAFLRDALTQVQGPGAIWTARDADRRRHERRVPSARAEALRGFFTDLLPRFNPDQVMAIVGLVYTGATGPSLRGMPDLTAIVDDAVVFVDVKAPGERTSENQRVVEAVLSRLGLQVRTCRLTERDPYPWERPQETETEARDGVRAGEARAAVAPGHEDAVVAEGAGAAGAERPATARALRRCTACGLSLSDSATFCPVCGTPTPYPEVARARCDICGGPLISLEDVSVCGRCRYGLANSRRRRIVVAEEPVHEAWSCRVSDPDRAAALYRQSIDRFMELDQDTLASPEARAALLYVFDRLTNLLVSRDLQVEALEAIEWAASLGLLDDDDPGTRQYRDSLRKRRDRPRRTLSRAPRSSRP
jgi:hypothetical protein